MGLIGAAMTRFDLKYVDKQKDRRGRGAYYYFRRSGRRWELPGEPLSEEFMTEYRRLLEATAPRANDAPACNRKRHVAGSFGALVDDYFGCAEFKDNRASTRSEYRRVLEGVAGATWAQACASAQAPPYPQDTR